MKKLLLCILLLMQLAPDFIIAQSNPTYLSTYTTSSRDEPYGCINAGNNDFLLSIYSSRLMKLRDDGTVIWFKNYNYPNLTNFSSLSRHSGGYYVAGQEQNTVNSAYDAQLVITSVDTAGALLWTNTIDSTRISDIGIETMPDGGVIAAYTSNNPGSLNIRMCRFTATGVLRWHKQYSFTGTQGIYDDFCADPTDPGTFLVLGRHSAGATSLMYKIDSLGTVLWSYSNSLSGSEIPRSFCSRNGGFAVCTQKSISTVSPTGTFISTKTFNPASGLLSFYHIRSAQDGGMIVTGQFNNVYEFAMKTDSLMNVEWAMYNSGLATLPIPAVQCPDGDFFIPARWDSISSTYMNLAAYHYNSSGFTGCFDIPVGFGFMMQGTSITPAPLTVTAATMGTSVDPVTITSVPLYTHQVCFFTGTGEIAEPEKISFSPNPSDGKIMFSGAIENGSLLEVYDVSGKRCAVAKITEQSADLSALENGLYLLKIISGDKVKSGRLVIVR